MELVYLYIKEYKNLKDLNLNFGCEYIFQFDQKINKLELKNNELFIADFYDNGFSPTRILNISSIIGENGSGKTSILNFIKDNLVKGTALFSEAIFIIKENRKFTIYSTFENLRKIEKVGFEQKFIPRNTNSSEEIDFGYEFRGFENQDIIYFSNIFDGSDGRNVKGLYDISTNHLVNYDHQKLFEQKIIDSGQNHLKSFVAEELFRQLKFINSQLFKDNVPFNLPDLISIEPYEKNFWITLNDESPFNLLAKRIIETFEFDFERDEKKPDYRGLNTISIAAILNLLRELDQIPFLEESYKFKLRENLNFVDNDKLIKYEGYSRLVDYTEKVFKEWFLGLKITESDSVFQIFQNTFVFINFLNENKSNFINSYLTSSYKSHPAALIDISENVDLIQEFLSLYLNTFSINQYLKFSWRGLSSGENALLNIYSRLFTLSDSQKFGEKLSTNLLILIDEGDTYLHPSWQKELLRSLLEILPEMFKSSTKIERTIQIISTTNSPIPASDYLNYNTVFLKKEKDGNNYRTVLIDNLEDQHETFAANIQSLLSNSFFVNNNLIGNFAKEKINQLILSLKSLEDISLREREKIRKMIHQIGEPVVKNKLQQMYNDRFNLDIHERLDNLEKRLGDDEN